MVSGFALNQTLAQVGTGLGPAVAGYLIAQTSLTWTYGFEAAAFLGAALAMVGVGPLIPEGGGRTVSWDSIREGLAHIRSQSLLQGLILIDLNAMVFGMPRALFPAMGTVMFGGDASTVGLLYAAPGIGALIAAITSGWVTAVRRSGRVIVGSVVLWGASIAVVGFSSSLVLALVLLAIAGGADVVSAVFRNTVLQMSVPDPLRGRLSAIYTAVVSGGPRLGDLEAGAVAAAVSTPFSIASGGVACVVGAIVIAKKMPQMWTYRTAPEE